MTRTKPCRQRHTDRPQTASAAPRRLTARSAPRRGGEGGDRLEHDHAEPAIAELDEERQRLLELRRGRLGIAQVGVDSGEAPEHLAECAAVADCSQDVKALVGLRPRVDERARGAGKGEAEEPERNSVRVAEAAGTRTRLPRRAAVPDASSPMETKCIASLSIVRERLPPRR